MIDFSCKVHGDFSPNGLQKVFCSFHPSDKRQMEKIADDILSVADCAVYYHTDQLSASEIDLEDYGLKLKEMKLFVIIVTTNYLSSDSLAKNWEYGFAVKNHIPILPITAEANLEEFFSAEMNRVGAGYGDVQLLKSRITDKTEISYRQKLLRDLGAILVDDREAERINKAFTGKVFLSYRKRDRKYANELMRTIHSIPSLQNVSIWYDEFISSGEKWSDQIRDALTSSDVFLLMVTPFITEPDNYVIKEEYPAARKQDKIIVSARKTDHQAETPGLEELEQVFPGLKVFVDGDDAEELEKALHQLSRSGESSAEKDYLIGVAFLNGIGVERDSEKAVSLMLASAQRGLPEAVNKLAEMYWTGDGVALNYEQSILWRKKLVEICGQILMETDTFENGLQYIEALEKLASCLSELSAFRESLFYGEELKKLLERTEFPVSEIRSHYQALVYDLCGTNSRRLGLYDNAISYGQKYCELAGSIYESEATMTNLHNLSVTYERMGYAYYSAGDMHQAEEWYLKAFEIDMKIDRELQSFDSAFSLSASSLFLGDIYLRNGAFEKANQYHERALNLRKRILEAEDSDKYRAAYGEALLSLGTSTMLKGEINEAKKLFAEALDVKRQLAETCGTLESQYAYSLALNRCGQICEIEGDLKAALEYYSDSLDRRNRILSRTRTAEAVYEYAFALYLMANAYHKSFDYANAKKKYSEVVENLRPILVKDGKGDWHRTFAEAAFEWFKLDTFAGKCYLQYAIDAWKWLNDRWPENQDYLKQYEQCRKIYRRCYPE